MTTFYVSAGSAYTVKGRVHNLSRDSNNNLVAATLIVEASSQGVDISPANRQTDFAANETKDVIFAIQTPDNFQSGSFQLVVKAPTGETLATGSADLAFRAGNISANSTPPGAAIIITPVGQVQGVDYGRTPKTVSIAPGSYDVRLHLDNYWEHVQTVTVVENQTVNVNGSLQEIVEDGGYGGSGYSKEYIINYANAHGYIEYPSGHTTRQMTDDLNAAERANNITLIKIINAVMDYAREIQTEYGIQQIMAQHPDWTRQQAEEYYAYILQYAAAIGGYYSGGGWSY